MSLVPLPVVRFRNNELLVATATVATHTRQQAPDRLARVLVFTRTTQRKSPGSPGEQELPGLRRTGRRAGRPEPGVGRGDLRRPYEHPVVSPQFSHLWQVPLRTVSHPQRGHGGASGVEFMRRTWLVGCAVDTIAGADSTVCVRCGLMSSSCGAASAISV